jgi:hypothetical protein
MAMLAGASVEQWSRPSRFMSTLPSFQYTQVYDQTVGNVLQRHGLVPAPERKRTTTWPAFIRTHLTLLAGTDFFTAEVLTRPPDITEVALAECIC